MRVEIASKQVKLHETPLEEILVLGSSIEVTFDDTEETRWKLTFRPYQGLKVTTIDCAATSLFIIDGKRPQYLLEAFESSWVKELSDSLKQRDRTGDFMSHAHHYIIPCQDNIIEVVAWDNFSLEKIKA